MKRIRVVISCFLLFLVSGCSNSDVIQTHEIVFEQDVEVEYRENVDTSMFVQRVDSFLINDSMREKNQIYVSNFTVDCPKLETKKLGKVDLNYYIGEEKYTTSITVVDKIAPMIKGKEELTFEVGEMRKLHDYFKITDNFDKKKSIKIKVINEDKLDIHKVGSYELKLIATDSSGNKAMRKVSVTIKDSKKEEEERKQKELEEKKKQENLQSNHDSSTTVQPNSNQANNNSPNTNQQTPQRPQPTVPKPTYTTKDFLFTDGYDMETAPNACQLELLNSGRSGSCVPLKNNEGIYIGMRLTLN